ncbi:GH3 auxin-responsive promoter family protein [Citrobacter braakii]|nr:GH3 auxin-responsive promoter family protein [Citrobacter braakii]MBJ8904274.1 GH3 auxin-responsive promoter family protein [Citrobacter braakii]MBJ8907537.1 GH3 auxin-responsive promoter family protein [Citrobacter braakii]MBJ8922924.1 GH3 auxin-responsive promoter family protein [Citrobacter braakii]
MSNPTPWHHFQQWYFHGHGSLRERQEKWLMNCLRANQNSLYGKEKGFAAIATIASFQQCVPVVEYETLTPLIERIVQGQQNVLFCESAQAFERTGGSYSGGKLIPYSARGLADFRHALTGWLEDTIREHRLTQGHAYWALSPVATRQEKTCSGVPVGAGDALYLGEDNLAAFAGLSAVPLSVGNVEDMADWQLLTLYYLLCCRDLRLISVWSPAFLTSLMAGLQARQQALLALLSCGGEVAGHSLGADAEALSRYQRYLLSSDARLVWPELAVISCWADAASQTLADEMMQHFPGVCLQPKGLLSTEAVISVPDKHGLPTLCVDSNFYEFVADDGVISLADELVVGSEYRVIVTTNSGLYRYHTGDRVKCTGESEGIPTLRFIGRGGVYSDLVGEKLTEPFVINCLASLCGFAALAQDIATPGYVLLLDSALCERNAPYLNDIEEQLCSNPQYLYARRLGQLAPLRCQFIDNPTDRYLCWRHRQGKRLGDIKIPAIFTAEQWRGAFQTGV